MTRIKIIKEYDYWRAIITDGQKVEIVEGVFEDEVSARIAGAQQLSQTHKAIRF